MSAPRTTRSTGAIFAWPLVLAALSLIGLIAGLTGDGARDVLAWLLLGSAPVTIAFAYRRTGRPVRPIISPSRTKAPSHDRA
jgi:hypothetical protein|tara:strand:- start:101 stop:346 length:246 start_codon:yes stop_codon:yes gene_type:complete